MSESSAPEQLPSMEVSTTQDLRVLEDVGYAVIDVVHFLLKNARKLPFPLGTSIGFVEDTLSPWLDPFIASVEEEGLHLLSVADKKINAASEAALKHIPLTSVFITPLRIVLSGEAPRKVQSGLEKLRRRGVVGCTADAWVKYESVLKSTSQGMRELVSRVPGSSLAFCFLHEIGSPLVAFVSDWLVDHSERKEKHQDLFTDYSADASPRGSSTKGGKNLRTIEGVIESEERGRGKTDDHKSAEGAATKEETNESQMIGDGTEFHKDAEKKTSDFQEPAIESQTISSTADKKSVSLVDTTEGSTSEISVLRTQDQMAAKDGRKGKLLHVTPPEEPEEHDEILDLFDTWGLGVKAISPEGLQSIRTLSLQDRSDREYSRPNIVVDMQDIIFTGSV